MSQDTPTQESGIGCCSKSNVSGGARPSPDTNGVVICIEIESSVKADENNFKIGMQIINGGNR